MQYNSEMIKCCRHCCYRSVEGESFTQKMNTKFQTEKKGTNEDEMKEKKSRTEYINIVN